MTSHFYMDRKGCDVCGAPPPPLDESCPILKLIDEDTCDYVEDKDDLPLCSDPCLCVSSCVCHPYMAHAPRPYIPAHP